MLTPDLKLPPTAIVIGTFAAGSDEWHKARDGKIGGSECSVPVKLNPWASWFELYYRKRDKLRPIEITKAIKWGTLLEEPIYKDYKANFLKPGQIITTGDTFQHRDYDWIVANPDGLIWDGDGNLVDLLEIKTAGRADGWGKDGSDIIPVYYRCQLAWYCAVLGIRHAVLRALIGGNDDRTYRINISDEDIEFLIAENFKFVQDLRNLVPPNIDGHMATYSVIKELHPDIDGSTAEIGSALADELFAADERFKKAKEDRQFYVNQVMELAESAQHIASGERLIGHRIRPARGDGDPYFRIANQPKVIQSIQEEALTAA